jgi:hypothetical protein
MDSGSSDLANLPDHYGQVALLLPLHGAYAGPGQAIRNGFLAGYYAQLRQGSTGSTVKIYDTSKTKDIRKLYAQAVAEGAKMVIGPLIKSNVKTLMNRGSIRVPTVALNYVQDNSPPKMLFEFGINPQNEAVQAADKASAAGLSKAIIIAPQASWGKSVADAFTKQWQQGNGSVVDSLYYLPNKNLRYQVRNLLQVNESVQRGRNLESILGQKVTFAPQRRKDFDMIFLVAPPASARQIMPLLRFYYANNIPVYSISMIYEGTPNKTYYRDMDGIIFDDIPWVFNPESSKNIQQNISKLWPRIYKSYVRLYALGLDAFSLTRNLKQLPSNPNYGLQANTGKLYLGPNHWILQQFIWAKFKDGVAVQI